MQNTVYEIVTEAVLAQLERGVVPWHKTWATAGGAKNLVSRKPYRGINQFLLACSGYASPWWMTFNQAKKLGGHVRKGEKSHLVVFWKRFVKRVEDEETGEVGHRQFFMLRYFRVFNLSQVEGIESPEPVKVHEPLKIAEDLVEAFADRPEIRHGADRAAYQQAADVVIMPPPSTFVTPADYYSTLFHELTHSTGHAKRLDRFSKDGEVFGSEAYGKEELVAEMGAAFLSGMVGIFEATRENTAAYIDGWRRKIRADVKLVVVAASQAQRAADYIIGRTYEESEAGNETVKDGRAVVECVL